MTVLRVVLGDQLTRSVAALRGLDPSRDVVLMAEVRDEATYVRHHPKKIAFLFAAMRRFAGELLAEGVRVDYVRLDDPDNAGSLRAEVARAARRHGADRVAATFPGEWRVADDMAGWADACGVPVEVLEDDRFVCPRDEFRRWAGDRRQLRMEFFYREMRRRTGLLMDARGQPEGGRWNYDAENRERLPDGLRPPPAFGVEPDGLVREVLALVAARFGNHFGDLEPFRFATSRADAEAAFEHFVERALPLFGDYQDAMRTGEATLFHSVCSTYLNAGLLDPLAMCRRVEGEWRAGRVPLNAAEGFIRQIVGWREYVRGVYWLRGPEYGRTNFLDARRPLPDLYWTGETDMRCMAEAVGQTKREAYAHHIQRLMVTGNFALLAGISPAEVQEWYLAVYADAYEWVELPNVHGMVLHADGGYLASKPYAASGKYIDRMSDHCRTCRYDVKDVLGERACPLNALYWDFMARNRARLKGNPRLRNPYATLDRMDPGRVAAMRAKAQAFLDGLPSGGAHT
jgi:deoxyribodipyrimidine photolyase-related protein